MSAKAKAAKRVLHVPAIKLPDGRIIRGKRGETHMDIMDRLKGRPKGNIEHGFIDDQGRYQSRMGARHMIRQRTGRHMGMGRPDSRDLM